MWRSGLGKCSVVKRHGLGKKKAGVADSVLFSKQTFLVLAVQAPRRRGDGGIFLPEPELKKGASAAASVCLHHLFASCSTPTRRCRGPRTVRETLAHQGRKGARKGGAWEYLGLGPSLVSLDSSMFGAAKHRRAAPSHKAAGAGAVAASNRHRMNHDSLGLVFL
jgi:hypothetical protein